MTSSPADGLTREPLHTRSLTMSGCKRSDGLFEIEGVLRDSKPFDFQPPSGERVVAAGEPIHQMRLRIVFDETMIVREVVAVGEALPYDACAGGPPTLQTLVGLNIGRGWSSEVRRRLSGASGCVHFAGMLVPMAATAFQTMVTHRLAKSQGVMLPSIDSCVAYSRHSELVRRRYPTFYAAPDRTAASPSSSSD